LNSHPKTMAHEMAHSFGLGHTKDHSGHFTSEPGCGATRGSTNYLNDAESDGAGEIMNYCTGDEYFSDGSDEYSSLKQVFQKNGWMQ
ncbi:MAG: hypothetical protein H8Z69_06115, partial [Nanohaloarchaea archaeon]|nr:hypothetical protein [Candidatus Nanohaloarchaea archaeon]